METGFPDVMAKYALCRWRAADVAHADKQDVEL
jgi:hypothetical protein